MKKLRTLVVALGLATGMTSAHADIWNKECHYEYTTQQSGEWTIIIRHTHCTIFGGLAPVWGGPSVEYGRYKTNVVQPTAVAVATPM